MLASTVVQSTTKASTTVEAEEIVDVVCAAAIVLIGIWKGYKSYQYNRMSKEALNNPLTRSVLSENDYNERIRTITWCLWKDGVTNSVPEDPTNDGFDTVRLVERLPLFRSSTWSASIGLCVAFRVVVVCAHDSDVATRVMLQGSLELWLPLQSRLSLTLTFRVPFCPLLDEWCSYSAIEITPYVLQFRNLQF